MMRHTYKIALSSLYLVAIAGQLPAAEEAQQQRAEVLEWLGSYVGDELLLKPEDLQALIDDVGQMPKAEFQRWYSETGPLRRVLQSPEWQETRAWLREFLAVQAIYSDEQLDEFRSQAAKMSPREMLEAVRDIQRRHQSMAAMHASSRRSREMSLSMRNARMQQQYRAVGQLSGTHAEGPRQYYSNARPGPVRVSYAERMNVYRRPFYVWYGLGWWGW